MKKTNRSIIILLMTIVLLVLVQAIRMNLFFSEGASAYLESKEYLLGKSVKLTEKDLDVSVQKRYLASYQ